MELHQFENIGHLMVTMRDDILSASNRFDSLSTMMYEIIGNQGSNSEIINLKETYESILRETFRLIRSKL
jgi:hypothetical protein